MVWDLGQCVVKIKAASEKFDQISGRLCCRQWTNLDPDFLYQINWKESVLPVRWKVTKGKKGNLAKKKRMGLGQGGWGAGGGRPLLSLRMRKSCRNQSLNVLIVFLRSPVHHDRHRQSQDEDADESAKASNQLRKELLKSESVAQQEVGANSAEINFFPFPRVCQRACQVEDWRRRGHCWTNSGVHEFPTLFSLLREGEKEENARRRDGWAISVGGDVLGGFNTGASSPRPPCLILQWQGSRKKVRISIYVAGNGFVLLFDRCFHNTQYFAGTYKKVKSGQIPGICGSPHPTGAGCIVLTKQQLL